MLVWMLVSITVSLNPFTLQWETKATMTHPPFLAIRWCETVKREIEEATYVPVQGQVWVCVPYQTVK